MEDHDKLDSVMHVIERGMREDAEQQSERFPRVPDLSDLPLIRAAANEILHRGFSFVDALYYLRSMEEVNPNLPEEVGLRRMKQMEEKYPRTT